MNVIRIGSDVYINTIQYITVKAKMGGNWMQPAGGDMRPSTCSGGRYSGI